MKSELPCSHTRKAIIWELVSGYVKGAWVERLFLSLPKKQKKKWTATTWQPMGEFDTIPFFTAVEEVFWGLWSRENVFACCCQHAVFVVKLRARLRTELFLCEMAFRPHASGVNDGRERNFFKTFSRVAIFENAFFFFSCGRWKTWLFENDND